MDLPSLVFNFKDALSGQYIMDKIIRAYGRTIGMTGLAFLLAVINYRQIEHLGSGQHGSSPNATNLLYYATKCDCFQAQILVKYKHRNEFLESLFKRFHKVFFV
jgi:hypothetical protein